MTYSRRDKYNLDYFGYGSGFSRISNGKNGDGTPYIYGNWKLASKYSYVDVDHRERPHSQ